MGRLAERKQHAALVAGTAGLGAGISISMDIDDVKDADVTHPNEWPVDVNPTFLPARRPGDAGPVGSGGELEGLGIEAIEHMVERYTLATLLLASAVGFFTSVITQNSGRRSRPSGEKHGQHS